MANAFMTECYWAAVISSILFSHFYFFFCCICTYTQIHWLVANTFCRPSFSQP
jgi:hypothetical protein